MTSLRRTLSTFDKRFQKMTPMYRSVTWKNYLKEELEDAGFKSNISDSKIIKEEEGVVLLKSSFEPDEIDFLKLLWKMCLSVRGN